MKNDLSLSRILVVLRFPFHVKTAVVRPKNYTIFLFCENQRFMTLPPIGFFPYWNTQLYKIGLWADIDINCTTFFGNHPKDYDVVW